MNLLGQLFSMIVTNPIFNVLLELYHWLGDFGLSIVALTVLTYICLLPFTQRQLKRTRAMQALRPEIAEINRRFSRDLPGRRQAQQDLFKQHGLSVLPPLGSMLLQMLLLTGLFFALTTVLSQVTAAGINQVMYPFFAHFSQMPNFNLNWLTFFNAGWYITLGLPDRTHILPILTGVVTFLQMRMSQPPEAREALLRIEQASRLLGPILATALTLFFAWRFAAGVALYRLVYLLLNSVHRFFVAGPGSLSLATISIPLRANRSSSVQAVIPQAPLKAGLRNRRRRNSQRKQRKIRQR